MTTTSTTTSSASDNSNIGTSILTALGAYKIDVNNMAQILAKAEVTAQQSSLDSSKTKYTTELNGFDTLQQSLQGFASQISTLTDMSTFQQKTVTSSDSSVIDATVSGNVNNATYQVEVQKLASAQTLATQTAFQSSDTAIGQGTLSFTVAGATTNITIDSSNDTLTGIQNAVNSANFGVTATVVNVGSGYKLVFSSDQTGAANQMTISTTDSDGNNTDASGLSQLINANMNETIPAQDATVVVNGLSVNSASNNVSGVIQGVTLNLKSADLGATKTLQIGSDTSNLETNISDFVTLYNSLNTVLDNLGSYSTSSSSSSSTSDNQGALKGDSTLREVQNDIRQAMINSIPGLTGSIQSMADIGITTNLDGSLSLDSSKLSTALANNPEAVGKLFAANATATDGQVTYKSSTSDTVEGTFNLTINTAASQSAITGGAAVTDGSGNITIDGNNNTLQVSVNGTQSSMLTLASGSYTPSDLAKLMTQVINNDSAIKDGGSSVTVQYDSNTNAFTVTNDKYGSASTLSLDGGTFLTATAADGTTGGLATASKVTGQDVQGSLEKNGSYYTFMGTGQDVTINSILAGSPKGLEFTVGGSQTGSRGTITFNRGYADNLSQLFTNLTDSTSGLIGTRISNINDKLTSLDDQQTKIDDRYNQIFTRYQTQFTALQTLLSQLSNTKTSLESSLSNLLSSSSSSG